jgi:hypothetical protein
MAVDCEYLAGCPIFAQFKNEGVKNFWIRLYCKGPRQEDCARKSLKEAGEPVPKTMLPNGKHLDVLDRAVA